MKMQMKRAMAQKANAKDSRKAITMASQESRSLQDSRWSTLMAQLSEQSLLKEVQGEQRQQQR
jgi:hypothetical protein